MTDWELPALGLWALGFFALAANGRVAHAMLRGGALETSLLSALEFPAWISLFIYPFLIAPWFVAGGAIAILFMLVTPAIVSTTRLPFFFSMRMFNCVAGLGITALLWWLYIS